MDLEIFNYKENDLYFLSWTIGFWEPGFRWFVKKNWKGFHLCLCVSVTELSRFGNLNSSLPPILIHPSATLASGPCHYRFPTHVSASSLHPWKTHGKCYDSKLGPRPHDLSHHPTPVFLVFNCEFQLPEHKLSPHRLLCDQKQSDNLSVPVFWDVQENNNNNSFVWISWDCVTKHHPKSADEKWVQISGVGTIAIWWCYLLMLIFKTKLVFCMPLLLIISLFWAFFWSYFAKVAVCCTLGINRHSTTIVAGWWCGSSTLNMLCASSLQEIQESCRSFLRQAGPAELCSHQVHVLCQALHTKRIVLGFQDSQQAEASEVEQTTWGLRSGKQQRENSNGAPGLLKSTFLWCEWRTWRVGCGKICLDYWSRPCSLHPQPSYPGMIR